MPAGHKYHFFVDSKALSVHNKTMGKMKKIMINKVLAILFTATILTGCGETDPKGDTAKESVDKYVETLTTAEQKAKDVVKTVEDKQADYLKDIPVE